MSRYDATQSNESTRSSRIYKDLNLNFEKNTVTKDIQKITDVEAVKRSVRNLINTNHYEKPFHPEIGSNLRAMLFENLTKWLTGDKKASKKKTAVKSKPKKTVKKRKTKK